MSANSPVLSCLVLSPPLGAGSCELRAFVAKLKPAKVNRTMDSSGRHKSSRCAHRFVLLAAHEKKRRKKKRLGAMGAVLEVLATALHIVFY